MTGNDDNNDNTSTKNSLFEGEEVDLNTSLSFASVPLKFITPEVPLPCDVYVFVNGHFIKFKHKGDFITPEKYNHFMLCKVSHLFTSIAEADAIRDWIQQTEQNVRQETLDRVGAEHEEMVTISEDIKKEMLGIFAKEITNEEASRLYQKSAEFVRKAGESKEAHAALRRLLGYSRTLADHSVNVANLSIYLAHFLNYSNTTILKNIYLGALYHDIGKTRIDPNLNEESNPKAFAKAEKAHPDLGKTLLLTKTDLPEEVLRIVGEHHEQNDGKGHPKKLNGARIFDLAKIVSIANIFDNLVAKGEGDLLKRQRNALEFLKSDGGHMFDPKKLEKCIEAINYGL